MLRVRSPLQLPAACQRAIHTQSVQPQRRARASKKPCSVECSPIEAILWPVISRRWPNARREYKPLANRKFRIDIAFPSYRLGIEADGWQYHGKFLRDHQRDRERRNLLVLNGWRILHYTAKDIRKDMDKIIEQIERALQISNGLNGTGSN
jgi:very-short-patch-repair endonuclease